VCTCARQWFLFEGGGGEEKTGDRGSFGMTTKRWELRELRGLR